MLNKAKGNMYPFVTHTWNPIRGKCSHDCVYCYMKVQPQGLLRLNETALKDNLGSRRFIFIGSSTDMFAKEVPEQWILDTITVCFDFNNHYLFQTKNPQGMYPIIFPNETTLAVTIESNRDYKITKAPTIDKRAKDFLDVISFWKSGHRYRFMVSIEPILDFDLNEFISLLKTIEPHIISIGADSKNHNLPEPSPEKIKSLITECKNITPSVVLKENLKRLYLG